MPLEEVRRQRFSAVYEDLIRANFSERMDDEHLVHALCQLEPPCHDAKQVVRLSQHILLHGDARTLLDAMHESGEDFLLKDAKANNVKPAVYIARLIHDAERLNAKRWSVAKPADDAQIDAASALCNFDVEQFKRNARDEAEHRIANEANQKLAQHYDAHKRLNLEASKKKDQDQ